MNLFKDFRRGKGSFRGDLLFCFQKVTTLLSLCYLKSSRGNVFLVYKAILVCDTRQVNIDFTIAELGAEVNFSGLHRMFYELLLKYFALQGIKPAKNLLK